MKTTNCLLAMLAVGLLGFGACSKKPPAPSPLEFYGVKVDLPTLEVGFTNASPEAQATVAMVRRNFRYSLFQPALMELDKLANSPDLTEPQKKLVADLIEQTRQVIAKAPPAPGQ